MREKVIVMLFYFIGLNVLSFGCSTIITADLGASPWDAFFVGLFSNLGLTVGTWVFIIGIMLIFINGMLLGKRPDLLAVITMFLIGLFMDFWLFNVYDGVVFESLYTQLLVLAIGLLSMATGISMYLQAPYAQNPIDGLMLAVNYRTGIGLALSKMSIEIMVLVLAFMIGGPIGMGTIVVGLGVGPLIQLFFKRIRNLRLRLSAQLP